MFESAKFSSVFDFVLNIFFLPMYTAIVKRVTFIEGNTLYKIGIIIIIIIIITYA